MHRGWITGVGAVGLVGLAGWWLLPLPPQDVPDVITPEPVQVEASASQPSPERESVPIHRPEPSSDPIEGEARRVERKIADAFERRTGHAMSARDREFLFDHLSAIWDREVRYPETVDERLERAAILADADAAIRTRFGFGVHDLLLELNRNAIREVRPSVDAAAPDA